MKIREPYMETLANEITTIFKERNLDDVWSSYVTYDGRPPFINTRLVVLYSNEESRCGYRVCFYEKNYKLYVDLEQSAWFKHTNDGLERGNWDSFTGTIALADEDNKLRPFDDVARDIVEAVSNA